MTHSLTNFCRSVKLPAIGLSGSRNASWSLTASFGYAQEQHVAAGATEKSSTTIVCAAKASYTTKHFFDLPRCMKISATAQSVYRVKQRTTNDWWSEATTIVVDCKHLILLLISDESSGALPDTSLRKLTIGSTASNGVCSGARMRTFEKLCALHVTWFWSCLVRIDSFCSFQGANNLIDPKRNRREHQQTPRHCPASQTANAVVSRTYLWALVCE